MCPFKMQRITTTSVVKKPFFAKALYFSVRWAQSAGVMLCLSTPESASRGKRHGYLIGTPSEVIKEPDWLSYECWFYSGVEFGNTYDFASGDFPSMIFHVSVSFCISLMCRCIG